MIKLKTPAGLKRAGRSVWNSLKSVEWLEDSDYIAVAELCILSDEIAELRAMLVEQPWMLEINDGKTTVLNPLRRELSDLRKQRLELLRELGLTVKQRLQLGLGEDKSEEDPVQAVLAKVAEL